MYIGLPQWHHSAWSRLGLVTLADYARYFTCVEGNTTLYALPETARVHEWRAMTSDDFRFCFKFPATISHHGGLRDFRPLLAQFFQLLAPLAERIGQYWLQLPSSFGPTELDHLWPFLDALPSPFSYGVEVRHPLFFAKGDDERRFNLGLQQRGINRVILDSRPVHLSHASTPAMLTAQRQKPRVPVHAVLTGTRPLVRFIGNDDMDHSQELFQPWLDKLALWQQDHNPFLFIHTPDIAYAPRLAQRLWPLLADRIPQLGPMPPWPQQASLF
ncbi:DUF72 domain-containing protein [Acerihabitans sp. TG2]|uniref:DUF72 domain-containing protein n=1 Tax=Acerihabitans sp. TG2 TaxID=3096008 RepID=UPI002B2221F1|nr:DUF72 domain-containing protein [Acerihabitans sp. TG2]MEA9392964.1 DUF72 domain-containing protein [Acerihabitans sp. TG2]